MGASLTEKYRPKSLEEIKGNAEVVSCLKSFSVETMPNMLFYGPPGTGKTTAIRAMLRGHPPRNVLELNASDERGIDTVRLQIKEFAGMKSQNIKVVVLDEADSMSRDAQNALRRIIEDFPDTRFCLICNFYKKIIDPIVSRCTKFRFAPVASAPRILEVCGREGIPCDEESAVLLEEYSDGDMRKVLNDVEGLHASYGAINKKNVLEFFRLCDTSVLDELYEYLNTMPFDSCKARLAKEGIDCVGLLNALAVRLLKSCGQQKLEILASLADVESRLSQGCSEAIQLQAIIAAFILSQRYTH